MVDYIFNIIYRITPMGIKRRYVQRIMDDKTNWAIYDNLKIPGFGTNLVRFLFPIYSTKNPPNINSISANNQDKVISYFNRFGHLFEEYFELAKERIEIISSQYPVDNNEGELPCINNEFFGVLDAAVLQSMLKKNRPKNYIEIGSGISTKYARALIKEEKLDTKIIAIDPLPRVEIEKICDTLIKAPLESSYAQLLATAEEGDIIFLDGSHYVFPHNDTVIFFFQILSNLPKGVIVHIHDIYLPFDYPALVKSQLWAENYLLYAWILGGGQSIIPLFPTFYLSEKNAEIMNHLSTVKIMQQTIQGTNGYSFWFKLT